MRGKPLRTDFGLGRAYPVSIQQAYDLMGHSLDRQRYGEGVGLAERFKAVLAVVILQAAV